MRYFLAVLLLSVYSLSALALPYSGVYFFGDSLTDVGNVQNTYAAIPHPPGAPTVIPGAPYDSSGRASNGPIYADVLAQGLGFSATPSTMGGNDFAFGGARTRYQTFGLPFMGILDQITAFRGQPGGANANALYVVWGGSNNLQDLIVGKTQDTLGNPIPGLGATVGDITAAILGLYAEGARTFLVPNAPDLSLTPRVRQFGAAAQAGAHQLSVAYNALLSVALNQLEATFSGLDIIAFDTFGVLNDVVANPTAFGIANTTDRCYTGDDLNFTGGGSVCANPDSYLFWDGIHPTAAVHGILGREMLAALPEPGSLNLVVSALLIAVASFRRQSRRNGESRQRNAPVRQRRAGNWPITCDRAM